MSPTPRFVRLAVLPALLSLALGCNSKDDSTNPVDTGGTGSSGGLEDISGSAVGALGFLDEFVTEVEALAATDFSNVTIDITASAGAHGGPRLPVEHPAGTLFGGPGRSEEDIVWNEAEQAWVADATMTETSPEGTATVTLHFSVQYRTAAGVLQQWPDELTSSMAVNATIAIDLEGQADGQVFDMSVDYEMGMAVGGLPAGPFLVDGTGALDMALLWTGVGTENIDVALGMDWLMDMNVPADGSCPTGTVNMNAAASDGQSASFVATYNGTATASWTMYEAGVAVESGTELLDCTAPVI